MQSEMGKGESAVKYNQQQLEKSRERFKRNHQMNSLATITKEWGANQQQQQLQQ